MQLILSLFPGIDLFGRGFEAEGYCVVRAPDLIFGGDIRNFHAPDGHFNGVIGGSPCQDFSKLRRSPPTGYGLEMLKEFTRLIDETRPQWFLLENVPTVPDITVNGYTVQRLDLNARECGAKQNRPRHFQFGSSTGRVIVPGRAKPATGQSQIEPCATATEGKNKTRRSWSDFCELQGLPRDFDLPSFTLTAKYRAVGNGVHIAVARTLARAIQDSYTRTDTIQLCACNCGRPVTGKQIMATPACRKRMQKRRDALKPTKRRDLTRRNHTGEVTKT